MTGGGQLSLPRGGTDIRGQTFVPPQGKDNWPPRNMNLMFHTVFSALRVGQDICLHYLSYPDEGLDIYIYDQV